MHHRADTDAVHPALMLTHPIQVDAEIEQILGTTAEHHVDGRDEIASRIPSTYHLFQTHSDYPTAEREREVRAGLDGSWQVNASAGCA